MSQSDLRIDREPERGVTTSLQFFGLEDIMRYHYEKPEIYSMMYGEVHECDHPVYDKCTLFKINNRGLAIIQQRYDP